MEYAGEPGTPSVSYEHAIAIFAVFVGTGKNDINAFQASGILASLFIVDKEDALEDVIKVREKQIEYFGYSNED